MFVFIYNYLSIDFFTSTQNVTLDFANLKYLTSLSKYIFVFIIGSNKQFNSEIER